MSEKLRRYYHGVVIPSVQLGLYETGNDLTKAETHDFLKDRFLTVELLEETNWTYQTEDGSTKALTTKEWLSFLGKIQRFAAIYLNVVVPDPNEEIINLNSYTN